MRALCPATLGCLPVILAALDFNSHGLRSGSGSLAIIFGLLVLIVASAVQALWPLWPLWPDWPDWPA